jgi:hypothetical protein
MIGNSGYTSAKLTVKAAEMTLANAKSEPITNTVTAGTYIARDPVHISDLVDESSTGGESSTALFMNALVSIEHEYTDRLQQEIEQSGIAKRMVNISYKQMNTCSNSQSDLNELRQLIVDTIDAECATLISWVKYMPDFISMCIEDQTCSLELNFLEVILLEYIWRSLEFGGDSNVHLHEQLGLAPFVFEQLHMSDVYGHMSSIVSKLRQAGLTKQEFLCLKVLILFKSDYGFVNVGKLEAFRQKCLSTLREQTKASSSYRYDSLLILLSDIKSISIRFVHAVFMFHAEYKIEMPTLLYDMLTRSQNLFGMTALRSHQQQQQQQLFRAHSAANNFDMIEEEDDHHQISNHHHHHHHQHYQQSA